MLQIHNWINILINNHEFLSPFIFIIAHILLAILFLPCSPMSLMAGIIWGNQKGLILSILASLLSCTSTFIIARYIFREKIKKYIKVKYPEAISYISISEKKDWKYIALTQINPILPASALGYLYGLSNVSIIRFIIFSTIFMIPLQYVTVILGSSVVNILVEYI